MSLNFKTSASGLGVRPPIDTLRAKFINRAVSGTNLTVVGDVYFLDTKRANTNTTTVAKAYSTIVAGDATNLTSGVLVVAEEAKLAGAVMRGVLAGPCKAYCYGALAVGDGLIADSTNHYFIKATAAANSQAVFQGTAQTATDALNLVDIVLNNHVAV